VTPLSRAFLAVYPPPDVRDALEERLRSVPAVDGLRWAAPGQWHVTLRFCGTVADPAALVDAVAGACARLEPVAGVQLAGAGAFPNPRRASVLWIGVGGLDARTALGRVAAALESACRTVGLAPDDRALRPHVTVARCPRARDLRPMVAALGEEPVGRPWTAAEVRLMTSDTRPTGAVHAEIARCALSG
jgi:2'-5' RNA ligase